MSVTNNIANVTNKYKVDFIEVDPSMIPDLKTKKGRQWAEKNSLTYRNKNKNKIKIQKDKNDKYRIAIYMRVSLETSLTTTFESQLQQILHGLKMYGYTDDNSVFTVYGESESAYNGSHRPVLQKMYDDIRDGKFDIVAYHEIDRMARNVNVASSLDSIHQEINIDVFIHPLSRFLDMSRMEDKMFFYTFAIMAEMYSAGISKKATNSHEVRAKSGSKRNSVVPFGMKDKLIVTDRINGQRKVYELDTDVQSNYPEEFNNKAAVVKEIYRKYNNGQSLKSIARWLNENIPTIKAKSWDDSTVKYILRNPVYFGGSHYKKEIVKDVNGNFLITNEPLVTLEYWTNTQTLIDHNTRVYKSKKIRHTRSMSPLHYIAKCECGGQLKRNTSAVRGTPFYSLKCVVPTIDKSRCNGVGISQEQLEKEIFEYTKDILSNPELLKHFVNNNNQVETRVVSKDEQRILDEINQLNSRIEIEQLDMVKQLLVTEVANKKAELNKMKMSSNIIINKVKNNNISIEAFEAAWNSEDKSDINALLSTIYKSIIISKSTISTSELNKLKKDGWFVDPKRVTIELHNGDKIKLDAELV